MKKFLIVSFLVLTSNIFFAQDINFGIKGGANYSNASVVSAKASSILSYHVGAQLEFKFAKFAIQPELQYSVLGADFDGNFVDSKARVGYLTVPVLAKIYFLKKLSVDVGPQVSYALNDDIKTTLSGVDLGDVLEVNKLDYGVVVGLTLNITDHLFIQGRGIYGFNDVIKNPNTGIPQVDSFQVKNRNLQLSIGYNF